MKGSDLYTLSEIAVRRVKPSREYDEQEENREQDEANAERKINGMSNMELLDLIGEILPTFTDEF